MRTFLLLCLLLAGPALVYCQSTDNVEEPEFKATNVPAKWTSESAVILAQKIDYTYVRRGGAAITVHEYVRKRIKLQDKNALEKFSEFYYVTIGKKADVAFSIIKPNGKSISVDMSKAIEVDKDVDNIFRPIYLSRDTRYFKMAIPDLEIGDIIDYHYASALQIETYTSYGDFTPYIFSMAYGYPVAYQKYQFDLDKGMELLFRPYNGAPDLVEGDGGYANKASDKDRLKSFYIVDKNRERQNDERWSYTYRNTPTVKLKVKYHGNRITGILFSKKGEASTKMIDLSELRDKYFAIRSQRTMDAVTFSHTIENYLKNNKKTKLSDDERLREIYYAFRKLWLEEYYQIEESKRKKAPKKSTDREDAVRVSTVFWAMVLNDICIDRNLGVEVMVVVPRYLGTWDDLLFEEELMLGIRVKGDKYYTLFPFNNFDEFAHPNEIMDGAEGYAFEVKRMEKVPYNKVKIPASGFNDNISKQQIHVEIPESMDLLKVERTNSYTGMEKNDAMTLAHYDRAYLEKDFKKYLVNPKKDKADTAYNDPDREERKKSQLEYLQKSIEREGLEVDKYSKFELLQDGRYDETPVLSYKENYTLKKLVNKAGRNYLLDAGKLIGTQIKLEEKELTKRENDIWMPYARTIANELTFILPKGYVAEGWQDMNMHVDNESGAFIATAKMEGNKLLVTTKKIYKKNFDKKERWADYVAFLEAAYKFTQTKVVLKKQ